MTIDIMDFMEAANANRNNNISHRWLDREGLAFSVFWLTTVTALLVFGWKFRDQGLLSAEDGTGYWLGIIGGSMMLFLLTYSMSKRIKIMRQVMPIKYWFQLHMTLGIVGPLCILFHSNFHLGSLNSTVALVCMLLVATSGIAGRYFYTRIHTGLYGTKIQLRDVLTDCHRIRDRVLEFATTEKQAGACNKLFTAIDSSLEIFAKSTGLRQWYKHQSTIKKIKRSLHSLLASIEQQQTRKGMDLGAINTMTKEFEQNQKAMENLLSKLASLHIFERLFSLWHVFHIPIFIVMILTAIVHIVVVHMY